MPVATRPKLAALATPTTASFPSHALHSASSMRTPQSASTKASLCSAGLPSAGLPPTPLDFPPAMSMSTKQEDKPQRTPITPPLAYTDFLKTISITSPSIAGPSLISPSVGKAPLNHMSMTASTPSTASTAVSKLDESVLDSNGDSNGEADLDSAPATATTASDSTDCSCQCRHAAHKKLKKPSPISTKQPRSASLVGTHPLSAPAAGPTAFPSFFIPPSPAVDSPVWTPFSARSMKSPFDWDAALKAKRHVDIKPPPPAVGKGGTHSSCCEKGKNVKHIREVVTRTVTYTPRMDPAPKGKRRKVE